MHKQLTLLALSIFKGTSDMRGAPFVSGLISERVQVCSSWSYFVPPISFHLVNIATKIRLPIDIPFM